MPKLLAMALPRSTGYSRQVVGEVLNLCGPCQIVLVQGFTALHQGRLRQIHGAAGTDKGRYVRNLR